MSKTVVTFPPDTEVRRIVAEMLSKNIGAVVVAEGETPVGIFSERDLMRCLNGGMNDVMDKPVSAVMTANPVTITLDTGFAKAMDTMDSRKIRHLPVVDGERLIGILSIKDMLRAQVNFIREKVKSPTTPVPAA